MKRTAAIGSMVIAAAFAPVTHAQYSADFQTNIISGITSNWSGAYYVGYTNFADVLVIENGGALSSDGGYVGIETSASNNFAVVSGSGSVWSNSSTFSVGWSGAGNTLVISGGAKVSASFPFSFASSIGRNASASNNHVVVTDTGSVWTNTGGVNVGVFGSGNALTISNGGAVFSASASLGRTSSSSSNVAVVTGNGSIWSNPGGLLVGDGGAGNRLLISDGGAAVNDGSHAFIGSGASASNNVVTVSGTGSVWSNRDLQIGLSSGGNQLVITNGGAVYANLFSCLSCSATISNNSALVVGDGSTWFSRTLYVGLSGGGAQLELGDRGSVVASNAYVGYSTGSAGNQINITGGSLFVTNAVHNGVLDVRCGTLTLNSGLLQADVLIVTNPCGRLIRTGGILVYSNLVLDANLSAVGDGIPNGWKQQFGLDPFDPNLAGADNDGDGFANLQEFQAGTDPTNASSAFRVLSVESTNHDILISWLGSGGHTNVVQSATDLAGGYSNVSPNIILPSNGDVTTNYLDTGAATNASSRYYRVRLVP